MSVTGLMSTASVTMASLGLGNIAVFDWDAEARPNAASRALNAIRDGLRDGQYLCPGQPNSGLIAVLAEQRVTHREIASWVYAVSQDPEINLYRPITMDRWRPYPITRADTADRAQLWSAAELDRAGKRAMDHPHTAEADRYNRLFPGTHASPAILVITDVGEFRNSEWTEREMYQLLKARHNATLVTVLVIETSLDWSLRLGPDLAAFLRDNAAVSSQR